jgi:6-phosphogluconolactonase
MNLKREILVCISLTFCVLSCKSKKENTSKILEKDTVKTIELLVGTYTNETSKGVYKLIFNPEDGAIVNKGLVAEIASPSFVELSKDRKYVYTVGEDEMGKITAFKWNADRTKLELINTLNTEGKHPCFVELNEKENLIAVGNYSSGNASVFKRNSDGSLQENPQVRQHEGSGSALPNQAAPHAHCTKFYKDKFVYVVDLGIDEVGSYSIDKAGELGEKTTALKADVSDGPRHLIFHPEKEISYVINEISNSIIVSNINQENGSFNSIQKVSTLPADFKGKSHCADIHMTADGKFLYASNRGHNSIAMFSVAENGTLEFLGTESVHGDWPRNIALSPDDRFLLVANQKSDNITVFGLDPASGKLSFTGHDLKMSKPVCLKF